MTVDIADEYDRNQSSCQESPAGQVSLDGLASRVMRADELVRVARERLGLADDAPVTVFADKLGYRGRNEDRKVRRWVNGENEPDYEGTLRLLAAAGLLREEAAAVSRASVDGAGPVEEAVLEALDRIAALLERQESVVADLRYAADALRPPANGTEQPPR